MVLSGYEDNDWLERERKAEEYRREAAQKRKARILQYVEVTDDKGKLVVGPEKIPVHADIYRTPEIVYSSRLVSNVIQCLERSIDADLRDLKNRCGLRLPEIHPVRLETRISPHRLVEFRYDGIAACLMPADAQMTKLLTRDGPLPKFFSKDRAKDFSLIPSDIVVPSWYVENADQAAKDINVLMTLRNAAILFNNLGAYELEKVS